jgi:putative transposase
VRLIISDACRGLAEAAAEVFPDADWQRCVVHFYRNVFSHVPNNKIREVARMLKAIHAQEDRRAARPKSKEVIAKLRAMKLPSAAELVEQNGVRDAHVLRLSIYALAPDPHQQSTRTDHS